MSANAIERENQNLKTTSTMNSFDDINTRDIVLTSSDIPCDISITSAALNIVDIGGDEPILNEMMLDLTDETYKFIHSHMEKCFKNNNLKFGKFKPQINAVKDIAKNFFDGEFELIEASQKLSRMLFDLIKVSEGVESCDLLTSAIITDKGPMLSIMKLTYTKGFIHEVNFEEDKLRVDINSVKTGLPNSNQKVLKAAFIVPSKEDNIFDLFYLDESRKSVDGETNEGFWSNNFLNCSEVKNSKSATQNFIKTAEAWTRGAKFDSIAEAQHIRNTVRNAVYEEDTIIVSDLVNELFPSGDTEKATQFTEFMACSGFEDEVHIDKQTAIKQLAKVKIQIDKDITLNISKEAYENINRFQVIKNGDGSINMVIKNIEHYVEK